MTTATKYKPYPKYRPSGVDWLGDIPEGWKVEYLKNLGFFASSGIDKKIIEGEPLIRMVNYTDIYGNEAHVIDDNRELMTVSCPAWKIPESNLIKGDLVFTPSSETVEDIGLSALIFENLGNTVFSYHVIRFRFSKPFDHEFKKYWCNNNFVLQQFSSAAKGTTRQILDRNDFKNIYVVIPPIEEQKRIADFLDHETEKIDEVIVKKQKLIELLKEKRQTLITRAVTKGLDPKAKMKPSGIDWLGDIPEGWEIKDLKYLLDRNDGGVWGEDFDDEGTPVLRSTEIDIGGNWKLEEFATRKLTPQEKQKALLKEGDLLITKSSGSELHIGKTALVNKEIEKLECCFSNFMQRLRPKKGVSSKLLFYFFNSYIAREQYNFFSQSTTGLANLSEGLFGQIFFVKIPEAEQLAIVDFLDRETAKIDEVLKKVEIQIEKLQEYRQALINDVVTGKIKIG